MTEVAFYHLTKSSLEQALPQLLEKTLAAKKRALVRVKTKQRVEHLNDALWTYEAASWLPHASGKDVDFDDETGAAALAPEQQIWLTDTDENINNATFLFLADGAECSDLEPFERCFVLFDGTKDEAVTTARKQWKTYADKDFELAYWQQTDSGGWQKKVT